MQPSAGPWLSPKVVTENSLPIVLPDMMQLFRRQHEDPSAAALEVEPYERKATKRPPHGRLGIPHLHDQQSLRLQMPTRFAQDDPHGVEAGAASSERDS